MKIYFLLIIISITYSQSCTAQNNQINKDSLYHLNTGEKIYLSSEVDTIAQFSGGEVNFCNLIGRNIRYPNDAREKMVEGKVYLSFIVEKDGSISDIKIIQSLYKSCDKEAIDALRKFQKKWNPAYKDGHSVRMQFIFPVYFTLHH